MTTDDRTWKRCNCAVWLSYAGRQAGPEVSRRSWADGQRKAELLMQQFDDGTHLQPPAKTVAQAIDLFLANKRGENLASDSLYRHKHITADLLKFCNHEGIFFVKDITLHHLTTWRGQWTVQAPQARRSRQEKVRNFFKFCFGSGMIATNPAAQMSAIKVKNDSDAVRVFEPKEYEQVIAATSKTSMTPENAARIKALMQLQRFSELSWSTRSASRRTNSSKSAKSSSLLRPAKTGTHVSQLDSCMVGQRVVDRQEWQFQIFSGQRDRDVRGRAVVFQKLYRKVLMRLAASRSRGSNSSLISLFSTHLRSRVVGSQGGHPYGVKALGHKSLQVTERFYAKWNKSAG